MNIMEEISKDYLRKKEFKFDIGDTVDVHVKVMEGDKERIQIFNGIVIARKGGGVNETFIVRRIVQGEGVERIFPVHSPNVTKIAIKRSGESTRRAKLYYLRDRVGKAAKLKDTIVPGAEEEVPEEMKEKPEEKAEAKAESKAEAKPEAKHEPKAEAKEAKKETPAEAKK
ncbi:MAG: 50S ribosomal protein L19 [Planctomycetes bacterium]|nr:50S ribosomal protein L19 [Planctomycetota bacterium]